MLKKDRIFTIVLAIVLGNLSYYTWNALSSLAEHPACYFCWFIFIADVVALLGIFYFIRTYLRGRKIAKQQEKEKDAQK